MPRFEKLHRQQSESQGAVRLHGVPSSRNASADGDKNCAGATVTDVA